MTVGVAESIAEPCVVATVGELPAAIWAPLRAPALRGNVLLVATVRTRNIATRVASALGTARPCRVVVGPQYAASPEVGAAIDDHVAKRDAAILINGGTSSLVDAVVARAADAAQSVSIATSRDHRLRVLGPAGEIAEHIIPDTGLRRLHEVLGVRGSVAANAYGRGGASLDVVHEFEIAGQWFVVTTATSGSIDSFRRKLGRQKLRVLGLDPRRVLVLASTHPRLIRATEWGHPAREVATPERGSVERLREHGRAWEQAVRTSVRATPDAIPVSPPDPRPMRAGRWAGVPLIVGIGPSAATTLTAIWAHAPTELVLVYDRGSPKAVENIRRIFGAPMLGVSACRAVDLRDLDRLTLPPGEVSVNLTPGDKMMTARLSLWSRQDDQNRRCWYLDSSGTATSVDRLGSRAAEWVPLGTRLAILADSGVSTATVVSRDTTTRRLCLGLLEWMARQPATEVVDPVTRGQRRSPPRVADGALEMPSGERIPLDACGPLGAALRHRGGGFFEVIAADACDRAGADEVLLNVEQPWRDSARKGAFEDELDVVTRAGGRCGYWSCKLAYARSDAVAGRAQADLRLGAGQVAVLVVPRGPKAPHSARAIGPGHWYLTDIGVHVIDASVLLDVDRLRTLMEAGVTESDATDHSRQATPWQSQERTKRTAHAPSITRAPRAGRTRRGRRGPTS